MPQYKGDDVSLYSYLTILVDGDVVKGDETKVEYATEVKLFGRWSYDSVEVKDISLMAYLNVKTIKAQVFLPFTAVDTRREVSKK